MNDTIKKHAISGTRWMTISTATTSVVQILRLSILARFLDKSDFGIVAILSFILGLTNTFADLGFASAIMHEKKLSNKDFSSLFWIQFFIFLLLYILISLSSGIIASFYKTSELSYLVPIALVNLLFWSGGKLYDTVLQKDLLFKTIAVRNIISATISLIFALILALYGFEIYSLVLSTVLHTLIDNAWNFISGQKNYKLIFYCNIKKVFPLIKIGLYQTGTQIVDYVSSRLDILIIGKILGVDVLGLYNLAKELVLKIMILINTIVNKVSLPIFAHLQDEKDVLKEKFCQVINMLSFVNFPIAILLCICSKYIIDILYGAQYVDAAPAMSILSIWSLFVCVGNPEGNLSIAKGRTDISFVYTLLRLVITLPIVLISSTISLTAVAWAQVVVIIIMLVVGWRMLIYRLLGLSFKDYIGSFFKIAVYTLFVGSIFYPIGYNNVFKIQNSFIAIIIYGILALTSYLFMYIIFDRKYLISQIKIFGQILKD
ncbi:MAG: MOP flippase family protein [Bacteroidales bacterium]|jgi:O-antigen/teichoic acid export membrane protein|nr:MOP flippase family protein [Bacteroidales bacterium]